MLIGYKAWSGNYLQRAHHASLVMGADIITSSAGGWSSCPDPTGQDALTVKEILDNGTSIIMPAGNGPNGTHNTCSTIDPTGHTAFFPLSPYYDDRIILVTSTGKNDYHEQLDGNGNDITHSHYPMVDICAPGYSLLGAYPTECGSNGNPYTGWSGGTSFATPIVAGTAALMVSVNECLDPQDIEHIIKATPDPVTDAVNYPGQVGAGRINAHQAVLMAQDYGVYPTITTSVTWSNDRYVKESLVIDNGATLTLTGTLRMADDARIEVKPGSKLIIDGGIITVAMGCKDDRWNGIYVSGNSTASQIEDPQLFGTLILKNGAKLENAQQAVNNYGLTAGGNLNWNAIGGIVQATDAVFNNNVHSARFMAYTNKNSSGNPINDKSYFRKCMFSIDDDMINEADALI